MKKKIVSAADYEKQLLSALDQQISNARSILKTETTEYNRGYLDALEKLKTGIIWNSPIQ